MIKPLLAHIGNGNVWILKHLKQEDYRFVIPLPKIVPR